MTWKPEGGRTANRKKPLSQHDELIKEMRLTRALLSSIAGMTSKVSRHTQNSNRTECQWVCQRCKLTKGVLDKSTEESNTVTKAKEDGDIAATIIHPVKPTPAAIVVNTASTTIADEELVSPTRSVDLECLPDEAPEGIVAWETVPLTSPLAKRHCTSLTNIATSSGTKVPLEKASFHNTFTNCNPDRIDEIIGVLVERPDPVALAWNIARSHYGKYLRNRKTVNKRCVCAVCLAYPVDRDRPILKWNKFGFTNQNEHLVSELSPYRTIPSE
jgi:hypothetical protein